MRPGAHGGDRASRLIVAFHQRSWRLLRRLILAATAAVTAPRLWSLGLAALNGDIRTAVQETLWIFALLVAVCILDRLTVMGVHVIQLRERLRRVQHRLHVVESSMRSANVIWAGQSLPPPAVHPPVAAGEQPGELPLERTGTDPRTSAVRRSNDRADGQGNGDLERSLNAPVPVLHSPEFFREVRGSEVRDTRDASVSEVRVPVIQRDHNGCSHHVSEALALRAELRAAIAQQEWDRALRIGRSLRSLMPDSRWTEEFDLIEPVLRQRRLASESNGRSQTSWRYPASTDATEACYRMDAMHGGGAERPDSICPHSPPSRD